MIGAEALMASLAGAGVEVCFANPGTSEMHLVRALDAVPGMRGVLTLFEGVATGAADGYARVAGRPAAVLLHLGPGLGNGLANLHNARRARTPVVCLVGAHATGHERYDAPLQSDIAAIAGAVSGWVRTSRHQRDVARDATRAVQAAREAGGQVATLIVPADVSWGDGAGPARPRPVPAPAPVPGADLDAAESALRGGASTVLLLGGPALSQEGLRAAARISQATGARLLAESFPARMERGAGVPHVDRVAYLPDVAGQQLAGARDLVLAGARWPVSFFAYPGRRGDLVPEGCRVRVLAEADQDAAAALATLAGRLGAPGEPPPPVPPVPAEPDGPLTAQKLAEAVAVTLPPQAVLVDEAITAGVFLPGATAGAARHTLLTLTGGAIGQGLPVATGAAVAAPGRRVVCVEADGSAMYTVQSLWTQARENLNVTTVVVSNGAYAILRMEARQAGAHGPGPRALDMFDLGRPELGFARIAEGLGVPAVRVATAGDLVEQLRRANAEDGPRLIEAMVPAFA